MIKIIGNGMYRIPYSTLKQVWPDLDNTNPKTFQLFGRGEEISIYIKGESDDKWDDGDYIDFYAQKNDGWFDEDLYPTGNQTNKYASLYSDTAVYYLTRNASIFNKHLSETSDTNYNSFLINPYCTKLLSDYGQAQYYEGKTYSSSVPSSDPEFIAGEGFSGKKFGTNPAASDVENGKTFTSMSIQNFFIVANSEQGPDAHLEFVVIGAFDDLEVSPDHHLQVLLNDSVILYDFTYEGNTLHKINVDIDKSLLDNDGATKITYKVIDDLGTYRDWQAISYTELTYSQNFSFDNSQKYQFTLPAEPQEKSYLQIKEFNPDKDIDAWLFDQTGLNLIELDYNSTGDYYEVLVPNGTTERNCIIYNDNEPTIINKIEPVSSTAKFTNYTSTDANFIMITHNKLMESASAYKSYRVGTGHNPVLIDVDELYHQFGYGIYKHPKAIQNFARYAIENWSSPPEYLFLIGKAYKPSKYFFDDELYNNTLIPPCGYPPSDNLFSAGITGKEYWPSLATGRLAAKTNEDVLNYLQKVKDHQNNEPDMWMKNIMHFGGGNSASEQRSFQTYLNRYKDIIEGPYFGGRVKSFFKTSSAPIEISYSDSIAKLINNGVSMMTFFGHGSATTGFDQDIDKPGNYENYKKYPFILANSCYTADIFTEDLSSSEEFILEPNLGAIGYLGSVSLGIPSYLDKFSNQFYTQLGVNNYGQPVGKVIQSTIDSIHDTYKYTKDVILMMTLHGDPAVTIPNFTTNDKPNYFLDNSSYYFDPVTITTVLDSFDIYIIANNHGKAIEDTFMIEVSRTLPDGVTRQQLIKRVLTPYNKDTIKFTFPIDMINDVGLNNIQVFIDAYNEIDESNELDNTLELSFLIKSTDIFPVYPYEYAIVPKKDITIKASTSDPFASNMNYIFQLDTTDEFNSPVKMEEIINSPGGVVNWPISLPFNEADSMVYYWRVSLDKAGTDYIWRESSFQVIEDKVGWGQAHHFQFEDDNYKFIKYNRTPRQFKFVNDISVFTVSTFGNEVDYNAHYEDVLFTLDGTEMRRWTCIHTKKDAGVNIAVFDQYTGEPWVSTKATAGLTDNYHCTEYDLSTFDYKWNNNNPQTLLDSIPEGNYILVYSIGNHNGFLSGKLDEFGGSDYLSIGKEHPYILFGRKGDSVGMAHEVTGKEKDFISMTDSIVTN